MEGNLTASARRFFTGNIVPDGSGSVVLHRGPSDFNMSAGLANTDYPMNADRTRVTAADGPLIEYRTSQSLPQPLSLRCGELGLGGRGPFAHLNVRLSAR